MNPDIIYTTVDEAPELASASLLPIVQAFARLADVTIDKKDISLAGRVIAAFPEVLTPAQRQEDDLAILGDLVKTPDANVIKLPNISASIPQLRGAIVELQSQGYDVPNYPDTAIDTEQKSIQARYDAIKGSAVNPVLREGNSDRRVAKAVKNYAMNNPHLMGTWLGTSKTHVSSMPGDDFLANETSITITAEQAGTAKIDFLATNGSITVMKEGLKLQKGTVVDATFMSVATLRDFYRNEMKDAKIKGVLFSLHLKATMMKISDPIIFGHAVSVILEEFVAKHHTRLTAIGYNPNLGLIDLEERIATLPAEQATILAADLKDHMGTKPDLYMVNSDKGITNLHVSSDVIVDASMPAIIRAGGKGWGPDGREHDCKCLIPDNCYASVYDETIAYFNETGALDPRTCGAVSNVGLMAQKAEEYGSHPTTFEVPQAGTMRYIAANGEVLHSHLLAAGDIWRSSSANQAPIEDWVKLGIARVKATGAPAVFWLNEKRAHDIQIIAYVHKILTEEGAEPLGIRIMAPREATRFTFQTMRTGQDVISITGNVLRDYLTDLFPILELGTSAKMLSVVKLMNGGGLFETGAGGSAPKHVQQLVEEGHLRWDSLGEFCALGESFNFVAEQKGNKKAALLAKGIDAATQKVLEKDHSPRGHVGQTDLRDTHYFFALYWAEMLAMQTEDTVLATHFKPIHKALSDNQTKILAELAALQGQPADLGGYYHTDAIKTAAVMRPSSTLNAIIG
ncbi:MAG: NADP-dependent isocitrate dehydrogenase [Paracoccaceae bacterium]|jgi:isocitrate dehydrogenase